MLVPCVVIGEPLTMSSKEIADLLDKRHDKVKQSIERLADNGIFAIPPMGETPTPGGGRPMGYYLCDKRTSMITVAQLSPEATARIVDRWQELEAAVASQPEQPTSQKYPERDPGKFPTAERG